MFPRGFAPNLTQQKSHKETMLSDVSQCPEINYESVPSIFEYDNDIRSLATSSLLIINLILTLIFAALGNFQDDISEEHIRDEILIECEEYARNFPKLGTSLVYAGLQNFKPFLVSKPQK